MNWTYKENQILSLDESGEIISKVDFTKIEDNMIDIEHVYVSPEYRGQGVADKTMLTVIDYLKEKNLKATASCSYANSWFSKNEEKYKEVIAKEMKTQVAACKINSEH